MILELNHFSRRFAIGDIHGCLQTLRALVEDKIKLSKTDAIILLGDYIDRGQNSSGTLDYIIDLIDKGFNIFPLLGNHELDMLSANSQYDKDQLFNFYKLHFKSQDLLDIQIGILPKYKRFFESLPFFFETENFFFVHASFDFTKPNPFDYTAAMMTGRTCKNDMKFTSGRPIIHGHQPFYLSKIKEFVAKKSPCIALDNGCVYNKPHKIYDYRQLSNLLALNLDTYDLIIQPNIESIQ